MSSLFVTTLDRPVLFFPGNHELLHWGLEDPAVVLGSEEEKLLMFRKIRDQLREHIQRLINATV